MIIPSLSPVSAHHDSIAGRIGARWTVAGDQVTYEFEVPEGSQGELILSDRYSGITVDGEGLPSVEGETARRQVAPGKHKACFRLHWHA